MVEMDYTRFKKGKARGMGWEMKNKNGANSEKRLKLPQQK